MVDIEPVNAYNWLMKYNWQQKDWPHFRYNPESVQEILFSITKKVGFISGMHSSLSEAIQTEIMVNLMVEEAVKTSEIEGEYISRLDIRSSIKNKLSLIPKDIKVHDRRAEGIAELMLDVRKTFNQTLTEDTILHWHLMLLASSLNPHLLIGRWREDKESMQIVSGSHGKWIVHFEAPPSRDVPTEMQQFIVWFNSTAPGGSQAIQFAPIRSAIAHLYFESIHPFDDGNGRIGRAIAEKALLQSFGYPLLLSLSSTIEANKKQYYAALKEASKSNEITNWIQYFLDLILKAQMDTEDQINFIINKAKFFDTFSRQLNDRQMKIIKRMMRAGPGGFEGGISAKKYMTIAATSKATATRDLQALLEMKALKQIGGGRSIHYELNLSYPTRGI
jgi:Fic family protein